MAKKPSLSQEIQSEQSERFIEAAKALESDETGAKFEAIIAEILPSKSPPNSSPKSTTERVQEPTRKAPRKASRNRPENDG